MYILNTSFNQRVEAKPKKHIKPSHSDFSPVLFAGWHITVPSFLVLVPGSRLQGGGGNIYTTPTKLFIRSEQPEYSTEEKR